MTDPEDDRKTDRTDSKRAWLSSDVTVTLPGWAFAAAGVVALLLLILAID